MCHHDVTTVSQVWLYESVYKFGKIQIKVGRGQNKWCSKLFFTGWFNMSQLLFWIPGFLAIWLFIVWLYISELKNLNKEISQLPKPVAGKNKPHPLIGEKIQDHLPGTMKPIFEGKTRMILVITSKSCPYCPGYFSDFIKAHSGQAKIPFAKIEVDHGITQIQVISSSQGNLEFPEVHATKELIDQLKIDSFPNYMVIDSNGVIEDYVKSTRAVIYKYVAVDNDSSGNKQKQKAVHA